MLKAFKYRIYPTAEQEVLMGKHFGAVRCIFNLALELKSYLYKAYGINISVYDLKKELPLFKDENAWLKEINSQSTQEALFNLDAAYKRFFCGLGGYPKYKKKSGKQSFACPQNFLVKDGEIHLPKFKNGVKIRLHRPLKGVSKSATISRDPSGRYFVSILCETKAGIPAKKPVLWDNTDASDMGLKSFIVCADGFRADCPKYFRVGESQIAWLQHHHRNKKKGSNNKKKANKEIAKEYEIIANKRKDFAHKLSAARVKLYDNHCFEDLNVAGMTKNRRLSKSITDAGWSMYNSMVKYKAEWKGGSILRIGTFEPSTKCCHKCWHLNHSLTLSDREWDCPHCGAHLDRDGNAAIVIKIKSLLKFYGLLERQSGDVEVRDLGAAVEALKVLIGMDKIPCLALEAPCV